VFFDRNDYLARFAATDAVPSAYVIEQFPAFNA
jgi:hypothetical protein